MAFLCVDKDGTEWIWDSRPYRDAFFWRVDNPFDNMVELPQGTIFKIINRVLTWEDEPVEI